MQDGYRSKKVKQSINDLRERENVTTEPLPERALNPSEPLNLSQL